MKPTSLRGGMQPASNLESLAAALYMARCRDSKLTPSRAALSLFSAHLFASHSTDSLHHASVHLRRLGLGPRAGAVLARFLSSPVEIDLHGNSSFGDMGAEHLFSLLPAGSLQKLDLGACGLADAFSAAFARYVLHVQGAGAQLRQLELGGPCIGIIKPNKLRQVPTLLLVLEQQFTKLERLGLSHNSLGEAADAAAIVQAAAALGVKSTAFSALDLSHNGFSDALYPLLSMLPLTSITELDISGNPIGTEGAALLAESLKVTRRDQVQ